MRKLRPLPIVISTVCAAAVLFGGWFTYQSLAMESPLKKIVSEQPAVTDSDITLQNSNLIVDLQLNKDANIREVVQNLFKDGTSIIGNKTVTINAKGQPSPELGTWWSHALFDVAGAMETKQYNLIPEALQKRAAQLEGLEIKTEMDDYFMYVTLIRGDAYKFILLPRTPAKVGAWQHA
ncbi:hypothetical protein NV379_06160 [Paenibacillus sp. N1-5-1-14]|uniref:hypothetical protein n=1 Tax=Paenibacillus radicibacter TaxID=2972488 RepID=UPI0021592081|nr:hypothetical protein [Paenibacillus radicibacter]MCR8642240.1 hypothetical protein [Paenibacillus radicibacter]